MHRKRHLKIQFVRLINGEEFPSEVVYQGLTPEKAIQQLAIDYKLTPEVQYRIKEIIHL